MPKTTSDLWATVRATIVAAFAGTAFAIVDLRTHSQMSIRDALAPGLLLVALLLTWWHKVGSPPKATTGSHRRRLVWAAGWLIVPIIGFIFGDSPEGTFLALPQWAMLAASVCLGIGLTARDRGVLIGTLVFTALIRLGLVSPGVWLLRELFTFAMVACGLGLWLFFIVPYWKHDRPRDYRRIPWSGLWLAMIAAAFAFTSLAGPFFLGLVPDARVEMDLSPHQQLFGRGLGSIGPVGWEFASPPAGEHLLGARRAGGLFTELGNVGLVLLPLLLLLAFSLACDARQWYLMPTKAEALEGNFARALEWHGGILTLVPFCHLSGVYIATLSLPSYWLNGWFMLVAMLATIMLPSYLNVDTTANSRASFAARLPFIVGSSLLLGAVLQIIILSHTAASIKRGGAIPSWAEVLPWTVPLRERCIRLREGVGEPGAPDPAPELKRLAERWTRLAPHDEYAWIERVRAVYAADGAAAAEPVAREATTRLPASPILARWLVRCLEESGRRAEAIAHVDAMRERFGVLHPTLIQWREAASAS